MRRVSIHVAIFFVLFAAADTFAAETDGNVDDVFARDIRPLLNEFCIRCHGPKKPKAGLRLDRLNPDLVSGKSAESWHDVLNRLNLGEMPPEDAPQPDEAQREKLTGWISEALSRYAKAGKSTGGRAVLRRLTRYEYDNTLRDLLGIEADYSKNLPPDSMSEDGFRNNGSSLGMSPLQIEYYLKTARAAMKKVIVTTPEPKVVRVQVTESSDVKRRKLAVSNRLDRESRFILRLDEYPRDGEFVVRVRAGAEIPEGLGIPQMWVTIGFRTDTVTPEKTVGEVDVRASVDDPQVYEFRGRIEEFPLPNAIRRQSKYAGLLVTVRNSHDDGKPAPKPPKKKQKKGEKKKGEKKKASEPWPQIVIESVEFAGPIFKYWPPETHTRILFPLENSNDEIYYAGVVLKRFMRRAWRRPVSDDEVDHMLAFFRKVRSGAPSFEDAIRDTLAVTLISPEFLYLMEPASESSGDEKKRKLNDFELATRLAYFLWSSMPDEQLLAAAEDGRLRESDEITKQVDRLLRDERSWSFVEQFATQWLDLDGLDRVAVNPEFYPDFDDRLKGDMRRESLHFFETVLRDDLSCLNFLDSDFAMLNAPLARHYGIDGPRGSEFEKVALSPESGRGGLLAQASILTVNSNGEDSHPIKRAVWLRKRLLNDPPPPPPPNVPELKADEPDFATLPLKEQLRIHRSNPACASCHRKIDPWGIPLEHFDATGRLRSDVRRIAPKGRARSKLTAETRIEGNWALTPVAASDTLPDGHEVDGLQQLKSYLLKHKREQFAKALVSKLLSYSLGRTLEFDDQQTVDRLTAEFAAADHRLRTLIKSIVLSEAFQTK